uniref:Transmembrane protein n=1 Tax=Steinernema glaseri TaxID=37863 RepID=A0A1I7ZWA0_9BILA
MKATVMQMSPVVWSAVVQSGLSTQELGDTREGKSAFWSPFPCKGQRFNLSNAVNPNSESLLFSDLDSEALFLQIDAISHLPRSGSVFTAPGLVVLLVFGANLPNKSGRAGEVGGRVCMDAKIFLFLTWLVILFFTLVFLYQLARLLFATRPVPDVVTPQVAFERSNFVSVRASQGVLHPCL